MVYSVVYCGLVAIALLIESYRKSVIFKSLIPLMLLK